MSGHGGDYGSSEIETSTEEASGNAVIGRATFLYGEHKTEALRGV